MKNDSKNAVRMTLIGIDWLVITKSGFFLIFVDFSLFIEIL